MLWNWRYWDVGCNLPGKYIAIINKWVDEKEIKPHLSKKYRLCSFKPQDRGFKSFNDAQKWVKLPRKYIITV